MKLTIHFSRNLKGFSPIVYRDESLALRIDGTIESLFGYLQTRSAINYYLKDNGEEGLTYYKQVIDKYVHVVT